ncbi:hypothetical protein L6452_03675 [Arctium lappa]|uniref:Uncharacterized protein n=1 Tax=Arctium lappa TaxID=4217 RepID=A0ACB9FMZ5_ARCLA|nr:hypothetical protein L6452_03675 [Arctium lappa]
MQVMKETAANIAASAVSGMDKTLAVIDEKVEKISTSDPVEKDMATLRKEDRIRLAELRKQQAYSQNAAAACGGGAPGSPTYTAAGSGHPEKNPFHTAKGDGNKPASVQQSTATVQSATAQPANTMSS